MLTSNDLYNLRKNLDNNDLIIIKFTADWCMPCKSIANVCKEHVEKLPKSISFYEINIEESLELYMFLKNKKQVSGLPTLLAFNKLLDEDVHFYLPKFSSVGGNTNNVNIFFDSCLKYVN